MRRQISVWFFRASKPPVEATTTKIFRVAVIKFMTEQFYSLYHILATEIVIFITIEISLSKTQTADRQ